MAHYRSETESPGIDASEKSNVEYDRPRSLMDNEGYKSNVEFDRPMAVRATNDRAPSIPEVSTQIAEEVEALHNMIGELFDTLDFILTLDTGSKDNLAMDRPAMSGLGQKLMQSRDGIHYACDRLRDLRMRIDL